MSVAAAVAKIQRLAIEHQLVVFVIARGTDSTLKTFWSNGSTATIEIDVLSEGVMINKTDCYNNVSFAIDIGFPTLESLQSVAMIGGEE